MARKLTALVLCLLCSLLLQLPGSLEEEDEKCTEEGGACVEQQSSVLKLDDSNFNSELEEKDLAVVVFHAPWSAQREGQNVYSFHTSHLLR